VVLGVATVARSVVVARAVARKRAVARVVAAARWQCPLWQVAMV
jgi:hypothetical protein